MNYIPGSWKKTSKNILLKHNILKAECLNKEGKWIKNEIQLIPNYNIRIENINGFLTYCPTIEQDINIMNDLFPYYYGPTKKIKIKKAFMLTIDDPKYNIKRDETLSILKKYKLPDIRLFFGYKSTNIKESLFYDKIDKKASRREVVLGMLEIFYIFIQESGNKNQWMYYFEDDVRPVNVNCCDDLKKLYNVPKNADFIRLYIGKNKQHIPKYEKYRISWGGGFNHAFLISTKGCKKVLNYALKYGWKFVCDIDLYKIAKYANNIPVGYDGWSFQSTEGVNNIYSKLNEEEKLNMYGLNRIIFDQTSIPILNKNI